MRVPEPLAFALGGVVLSVLAASLVAGRTAPPRATPLAQAEERTAEADRRLERATAEMRARLEGAEARLASAEADLARSRAEVARLARLVELRPGTRSASPDEPRAREPSPPEDGAAVAERFHPEKDRPFRSRAGWSADALPRRPVPVVDVGASREALIAALGQPDAEHKDQLSYYEQGIKVSLDKSGAVRSVRFYGEPAGDVLDQNGNYGPIFQKGKPWYHPSSWSVAGIEVGDPMWAVLRKLGEPTQSVADQHHQLLFTYAEQNLVIYFSGPPEYTVRGFRTGTSIVIDQNGNID